MTTRSPSTRERRSATLSAGIVLLAMLTLSNAAILAAPIPVPVIVISAVLVIAGVVAIVAIWVGRSWGRRAGEAVAVATAVAAAPGIFTASGPLTYVAGATAVVALACAALLLAGASGRSPNAQGQEA
ncbi:MAG: hypothetical protein ACXWMN_05400 [Candidatus Limnocylindria bacterium]